MSENRAPTSTALEFMKECYPMEPDQDYPPEAPELCHDIRKVLASKPPASMSCAVVMAEELASMLGEGSCTDETDVRMANALAKGLSAMAVKADSLN